MGRGQGFATFVVHCKLLFCLSSADVPTAGVPGAPYGGDPNAAAAAAAAAAAMYGRGAAAPGKVTLVRSGRDTIVAGDLLTYLISINLVQSTN